MTYRPIARYKVFPEHMSGYRAPFILSDASDPAKAAEEVIKTHRLAEFPQWSFRAVPNAMPKRKSEIMKKH